MVILSPSFVPTLILSIIGVSIMLMLVRPRGLAEVYWISGGVAALLALRLITLHLAWRASIKALDVCFFLIGMMLLSELAREHGVFDWMSAVAVRRADGSCLKLFALVYAVGTVVTVFMSNDATAVVLTPAILTAVRKAKVKPLPYLFVCAIIANAASFLLPISNPANLVVFHDAMPPLFKWLLAFGIPCVLSIVVTFLVLKWIFRRELTEKIEYKPEAVKLTGNGKLVLASASVMILLLLTVSSLGMDLGLPTCLLGLAILTIICVKERTNPIRFAREISWATLLLVVGLFVMVDAAESVGAMHYAQNWLQWAEQTGVQSGQLITGFAIGIANNIVNNLPLGLIVGSTLRTAHASLPLTNAAMIGVDLGPNLSITGSLATILWLIALRKENLDVSFWAFLKIGAIVMPVSLLAALAGSILMNTLFGIA